MTGKTRLLTTALALAISSAGVAHGEIGPYVGGSVGQTRIEGSLTDVGVAEFRIEGNDFAYKIFFGLELPGPIAVEGGYRDFGTVSDANNIVTLTSQSDGFDAFVLGKLPVGPVSLFAKAGLIAWNTEFEVRAGSGLLVPDRLVTDDGIDFAWGLGVSAELGKFGVRGEFERFEAELPGRVSMLSVGVTYEF